MYIDILTHTLEGCSCRAVCWPQLASDGRSVWPYCTALYTAK